MSALIQIKGLYRYFGDFCAVDDLSFELRAGEVLGFLGVNGAGKSTSMAMISGALAPSAGSIRIDGYDLVKQPIEAKSRLGYLPEKPPLYPDMKVDEYLAYCAHLRGISRTDTKPAVDRAKRQCGLTAVGARLIGNLSKGYQQRTGIAQAIIHQPKVIILDEPTSGLDPIQIDEIRTLISDLGRECAILLSTHILPEVRSTCNRVLILHNGRLALNATETELQQGGGLTLQLTQDIQAHELSVLTGTTVSRIGEGRYSLNIAPDTAIDEMTRSLVENGLGVIELSPSLHLLEQEFSRIASGENGA
jgi:ABC-2 type transport system ATP-binding protein